MTIVSQNLKVLNDGRQKLVDVGLRPTRVWVRLASWSAGEIHLGEVTNTDTEITPRPKVEHAGRVLRVSGITPDFTVGGYTVADLSPEAANAVDFYFLVRWQGAASSEPYRLVEIDASEAFSLKLVLEPLDMKTPDEFA
jgi:hypothetical protein